MLSLKTKLNEYELYHQSRVTQITHYIGIPAILVGYLLLVSWVFVNFGNHWQISFAWLTVIALLIYYFCLNIRLAALMTVILVVLTFICAAIASPIPTETRLIVFLILFIGGWILQFVGHTLGENKPAFLVSPSQIAFAPLYVVIQILRAFNLSSKFKIPEDHS